MTENCKGIEASRRRQSPSLTSLQQPRRRLRRAAGGWLVGGSVEELSSVYVRTYVCTMEGNVSLTDERRLLTRLVPTTEERTFVAAVVRCSQSRVPLLRSFVELRKPLVVLYQYYYTIYAIEERRARGIFIYRKSRTSRASKLEGLHSSPQ